VSSCKATNANPWDATRDRGEVMLALQARLRELAALPPGWNSYDAPALDPSALRLAEDTTNNLFGIGIRAPLLFPLCTGGVQAEWTLGRWEVAIEFHGNGTMTLGATADDAELNLFLGAGDLAEGALLFVMKAFAREHQPEWWKPNGVHRHSAVLQACAHRGMTAEQALDVMAEREQELLAQAVRLAELAPPPVHIVTVPTGYARPCGRANECGDYAPKGGRER
jgi:hypothetical protein